MAELVESAERVENGVQLTQELDQALFHGSSIGGARPKALIKGSGKKYIAKFSSSSDLFSVVKAEFIAMRLAKLADLSVANVQLTKSANKDVLLIERFDREKKDGGWSRKSVVSALTILGLDDMMARYASYETLAEIIRHTFSAPKDTLKELFSRLVFNTPAYDICPQGRTGNEASQAMLIVGKNNLSQLKTCADAAKHFLLSKEDANAIFDKMIATIQKHWDEVCDEAEVSDVDRQLLRERQFLNPFSLIRA